MRGARTWMRVLTRANPSATSSCCNRRRRAGGRSDRTRSPPAAARPDPRWQGGPTKGRRRGSPCRICAILRPRQRSHLNCGQADFASIVEHESASVENFADRAAGNLVAAADLPLPRQCPIVRERGRRSARRRKSRRKSGYQARDPPTRHAPPMHAKPKAGMRRSCGGLERRPTRSVIVEPRISARGRQRTRQSERCSCPPPPA
jgi:hypothetical protein